MPSVNHVEQTRATYRAKRDLFLACVDEVLRRLRELGCSLVMGNADAELLDGAPPGPETDEESRRIADISRWCAAQLDDADQAFLASFQPTVEISLGEERSLLCCHGSPRSYDDVIAAAIPDDEIDPMITQEPFVRSGPHPRDG